ncbi:MAG: DNA translocase FtsK 4TM domain-containing protein, partial [Aureliella sp.]
MSEPRKIKFDVEATVLAGVCALLWVSLLTYDAADPIGPLVMPLDRFYQAADSVYPPNESIQNWCGWGGALLAQMLVEGLGVGAIPLVAAISALTLWMFQVQDNFVAPSRQFGWLLVIVAFTTLATLFNVPAPQSPAIGPGGYLGALTTTWLNEHFALIGSVILTLAVMVAGLLLSTDYVVLRWLLWLLAGGAAFAVTTASASRRGVAGLSPLARLVPRLRTSDVDGGIELSGSGGADGVSIRIRGQQVGQAPETKPTTAAAATPGKGAPSAPRTADAAAVAASAAPSAAAAGAKPAESLIAGVAAVASNLLATKLKPDPVAASSSEEDVAAALDEDEGEDLESSDAAESEEASEG